MNAKNQLEISGFVEKHKLAIAKIIVLILHLVGIVGLFWETSRPFFQLVTPLHLLLVTAILLYFHQGYNRWFFIFALSAFSIGMITEIIGVNTGLIFGDYSYGPVLGPKLIGVPLLIGINWFLMVYLTGGVFYAMIRNDVVAAAAGAALMVIMDLNLEPVAVALNFWQWEMPTIPFSNYLSWFLIAFTIQLIYRKSPFNKENKLNFFLFMNLLLFFFVLAIIL